VIRIGIVCCLLMAPLRAHHEAAVTISELTVQIASNPKITELYYQRGVEYYGIQDYTKARADFQNALQQRPDYLPAKRYLAEITAQEGHVEAALEQLQAAMEAATADHRFLLPTCHGIQAQWLYQLHKLEPALLAVQDALQTPNPALETVRLHAQILRELGHHDEALACLKSAWEKSKAVILRNDWLDMLIALHRTTEALPIVEAELASTRLRSTWLIRRARLRLQLQQAAEAKADLTEAIAELTPRLATDPPPVTLLCDRALAYALLGRKPEAAADLAAARKLGISETSCRLVLAMLEQR
jgi:tetratricopeptide (TPR) repeat protein